MSWTRGQLIGHGATATVSEATPHGSNRVFAVKSAQLARSEFLMKEQRIMAGLNCPQIVSYKGWDISLEEGVPTYNLWMEYAPLGTVSDAVRCRGGSLYEDEIRSYASEILLGLNYLHSLGLVHCDIKGQNILLTHEGAKIADFGCAKRFDDVAAPASGTPMFMAPEVARCEQQGFPADVWAVGCTVLEMATGRSAWGNASVIDPVSTLYRIGFSGDVPEIPEFMSEEGKDFLRKCLIRDPMKRWTVQELLRHPFIEESISSVPKRACDLSFHSPTTVLDQGVWLETETEEAEAAFPCETLEIPSVSALRIKKFSELVGPHEMPRWELDGGWFDVRTGIDDEPSDIEELADTNPGTTTQSCQNCSDFDLGESASTTGRETDPNIYSDDMEDLTESSYCKSTVPCQCYGIVLWHNEMKDSLIHSLHFFSYSYGTFIYSFGFTLHRFAP